MTTAPGADELRIRQLLVQRGVGPDAPTTAPERTRPGRADDLWWDRIYDGRGADTHAPTARTVPDRARVTTDRLPDWRKGETTDLTAGAEDTDPDPDEKAGPDETAADGPDRPDDAEWADATDPDDPVDRAPGRPANPARASARRATAAYLTLAPRTRVLLYNGAAAGLGYGLGLVPLTKGWITACGHDTGNVTAALLLGAGLVVATGIADRRTRAWWPPLAWMCRIPLASALLALALYAPGTI